MSSKRMTTPTAGWLEYKPFVVYLVQQKLLNPRKRTWNLNMSACNQNQKSISMIYKEPFISGRYLSVFLRSFVRGELPLNGSTDQDGLLSRILWRQSSWCRWCLCWLWRCSAHLRGGESVGVTFAQTYEKLLRVLPKWWDLQQFVSR